MNSSCRFNVILPRTSLPNFKYPKKPVSIIKLVTITMPTFNTPNKVENCLGFFISCSKGKTYKKTKQKQNRGSTKLDNMNYYKTYTKLIPSNAKILVPKYRGIVDQWPNGSLVDNGGKSLAQWYRITMRPTIIQTFAIADNRAMNFKFLMRDEINIGTMDISMLMCTSNFIPYQPITYGNTKLSFIFNSFRTNL